MLTSALVRLHLLVYRATGGRLGGRWGNAPVLLLTTTGRRSGQPRTTPLLYLADGDSFVVVATNDGAPKYPQWYRNLQLHPEALIETRAKRIPVLAADATRDQRERLWPRLVGIYPNYERDRGRTERELPVVILRPH